MKKILITGGNGYIAKSLISAFKDKYEITGINRKNFDLLDETSVNDWFHDKHYDLLIHTAIIGGRRLVIDESDVLSKNLSMYNNLMNNKKHFDKFISFGSGAEFFQPHTPYGQSKKIIADSIKNTENAYNLRIFGVFDENEEDTRFIKSNLVKYIKNQPMLVHSNKIMDFIYMKDLISIVEYYINNNNLEKEINCCYENKVTLKNIVTYINSLGKYQVPIIIQDKIKFDFYCGDGELPVKTIGLEQGIQNTYKILQKNYLCF